MNGLGEDLFPGAALAVNQYADIGLRHHPRLLQQPQHDRAAGNNRLPPRLIAGRRGMLQRIIDRFVERVLVHRLGKEAKDPLLGGRNCIRDRAVGGEDNHRHAGLQLLDLGKQLHAVHFIHPQIADDQIDLLAPQHLQPFLTAFGGHHTVTLAHQTHAQQLQQARVVIHQQKMRRFSACHGFPSSCFGVSAASLSTGDVALFGASGR